MLEHCGAQGRGDRIALDPAAILAAQDFSPPCEPDLAAPWVAHHFADARDFKIERVKREQGAAMLRRRKQGAEIALPVARTNEHLAMREGIHHCRMGKIAHVLSAWARRANRFCPRV